MASSSLLASLIVVLSCLLHVNAIYSKNSPVLQVTAKTYDALIAQSNHTSIVEFYAPWCGHCQNLKPAYEKAAKNLAGLAKVAAIDCDDDANKPFCGQMGIQGFPTLKIVKPRSKPGRPVVEDYSGPRSTKGIVDAVKDKIPNHVKRLQGAAFDKWLSDPEPPARAVIFTDKGTTSPLVKSLAVDFLGSIAFAQVRDKATAESHHVSKFPTIQLFTTPGESPVAYSGDINRDSLVAFFTQVAPPNPDPAPQKAKPAKSSSKKPKTSAFSKASEAHKSSDFQEHMASSGTIVLDDDTPTTSPMPTEDTEEKPMVVPEVAPPLPTLSTVAELEAACLMPKSGNCILVLLPRLSDSEEMLPSTALSALGGFAEIVDKYNKRKASMIPTYAVPSSNEGGAKIRTDLSIGPEENLEVIAMNNKRGWWRRLSADSFETLDLESFVDAIKLGEGARSKLPADFGVAAAKPSETIVVAEPTEPTEVDDSPTSIADDETGESISEQDEEGESPSPEHDEL